jgi:regulator of RNase E activity RraA
MPFVDTAFTVYYAAADNLGLQIALKYLLPGDVLAVKAEECDECTVTGDLMMGMAQNSGLRAFVMDTQYP